MRLNQCVYIDSRMMEISQFIIFNKWLKSSTCMLVNLFKYLWEFLLRFLWCQRSKESHRDQFVRCLSDCPSFVCPSHFAFAGATWVSRNTSQ